MDKKEFNEIFDKIKVILKGKKDFVIMFSTIDGEDYYHFIKNSNLNKIYAVGLIEKMKLILLRETEKEDHTKEYD